MSGLRVFKAKIGDVEVEYEWSGEHNAHRVPKQITGWRELCRGGVAREEVCWDTQRGWQPRRKNSEPDHHVGVHG
jgi:hypothetical protein